MNLFTNTALAVCTAAAAASALPASIQNVQFSDIQGNYYDLFKLLDRGTHVYVELVDNI